MLILKLSYLYLLTKSVISYDPDSVLITYSSSTDPFLLDNFSSFNSSLNLSTSADISDFTHYSTIEIIVDISSNSQFFPLLDQVSEILNIFYLTSTIETKTTHSKFRFYSGPSLESRAQAASSIISSFKWEKLGIYCKNNFENLVISDFILSLSSKTILTDTYRSYGVPMFNEFIRSSIISRNIQYLVIIDNEYLSLSRMIFALNQNNFFKYGNYLLIISNLVNLISTEGSVVLSDHNSPDIKSAQGLTFTSISTLLNQATSFSYNSILQLCPGHQCHKYFSIFNVQSSIPVQVGTYSNSLILNSSITFLGNNSETFIPLRETQIFISKLDESSTALLAGKSAEQALWYKGAEYAVERSNYYNQVIGSRIRLNLLKCEKNQSDWLEECFRDNKDKIGSAFLSQFWMGDSVKSFYEFNNVKYVPQMVPFSIDGGNETDYDSMDYDEFKSLVRMGLDFDEVVYNIWILLIGFQWKDFIVFTTDDPVDFKYYQIYLDIVNKAGGKIRNPEGMRVFPKNYTRDDFEQYREIFHFAKESRCRIFHLLITKNGDIIEGLYDIGIKKGDAIIMGSLNIYNFLLEDIETKYLKKRQFILTSALLTSIQEYKGDYGKTIKSELEFKYGTSKFLCLTFDTISVLQNAFNYMILKGLDYENTNKLLFIIGSQKSTECSGSLIFPPNLKHRITYEVSIEQLTFNKNSKNLKPVTIAILNRYSATSINLIQEPTWHNSTTTPSNYVFIGSCGFDLRDSSSSSQGRTTLFVLSLLALTLCIVSSYLSTKFYYYPILYEDKKVVGSLSDILFLVFFLFELAQFLCFDHGDGIVRMLAEQTINLFGWDFFIFFDAEFDKFWTLYLILILYSFFLSLGLAVLSVYWKGLDEFYSFFHRVLVFIMEHFMPVALNVSYMPVISMLFNIYECTEATGDLITQSYLQKDCKQSCYSGKHLSFSIVGGLSLCFFIIICSYLRIFCELIQSSVHFCTNPAYLLLLNIFQVLLVLLNKNLQYIEDGISGLVISPLLILFALITFYLNPYNYKRITNIQVTVLGFSGIVLLLSSLYVYFDKSSYIYYLCFPCTGIPLLCFLALVQKSQNFFIPDQVEKIPSLIMFQFGKSIDSKFATGLDIDVGLDINNIDV